MTATAWLDMEEGIFKLILKDIKYCASFNLLGNFPSSDSGATRQWMVSL